MNRDSEGEILDFISSRRRLENESASSPFFYPGHSFFFFKLKIGHLFIKPSLSGSGIPGIHSLSPNLIPLPPLLKLGLANNYPALPSDPLPRVD
mgnify:FL=1